MSRTTSGPFVTNANRCRMVDQRLERSSCQAVVPLGRLVGVRGRPKCHQVTHRGPAHELPTQHLWKVDLHEDHGREVVARSHLELALVASGKAVVAAVCAPAVWVERPFERHPPYTVQGRAAPHLLVARVVGSLHRAREFVEAGPP